MVECPTCGDTFENDVGMKSHHTMVHGQSLTPESRVKTECSRCGSSITSTFHTDRDYCETCLSDVRSEVTGEDHPRYTGQVEVSCTVCESTFEVYPYRKESDTDLFCSSACFSEWQSERLEGEASPLWQGGSEGYVYGGNWHRQRRKALDRDEHRCRNCDMTPEENGRMLSVHHIEPLKSFDGDFEKANALDNLITVCDTCHMRIEKGDLTVEDFAVRKAGV